MWHWKAVGGKKRLQVLVGVTSPVRRQWSPGHHVLTSFECAYGVWLKWNNTLLIFFVQHINISHHSSCELTISSSDMQEQTEPGMGKASGLCGSSGRFTQKVWLKYTAIWCLRKQIVLGPRGAVTILHPSRTVCTYILPIVDLPTVEPPVACELCHVIRHLDVAFKWPWKVYSSKTFFGFL